MFPSPMQILGLPTPAAFGAENHLAGSGRAEGRSRVGKAQRPFIQVSGRGRRLTACKPRHQSLIDTHCHSSFPERLGWLHFLSDAIQFSPLLNDFTAKSPARLISLLFSAPFLRTPWNEFPIHSAPPRWIMFMRQDSRMGGDSSMSTVESGLEFPTGTENELLRIRGGAQLWLIDGEESVLMQSGDFAFRVIKQTQSPLATALALVAELQWPVGRDSPALKVGNKKYAFALPGLVYGLALPVNTPVEAIQGLEGLLQQYSTFEMHPEISDGVEINKQSWLLQVRQQQAAEYWTAVAPEVENLSGKIARRIGGGSPYFWSDMDFGGADRTARMAVAAGVHNNNNAANAGHEPPDDQAISPRMMKRIQQGRRMSAVAKLLSKTLLRGAISASRHVAGGHQYLGESNPCPASSPASGMALAGVDAFAKVVEAVETAGRGLLEVAAAEGGNGKSKLDIRDRHGAPADAGAWTLNKSGLRLLLRATAASAVIHVARGAGAPSVSSALSSPQSGLSQQGSIPGEHIPPPPDEKEKYARVHPAPHRPNSPFQQYSRPVDQPSSHFHFSLGIDANGRQQQQHPQQSM